MHARLFAEPGEWSTSAEQALRAFAGYATAVGADPAALEQCLADQRYASEVDADFREARRIGLSGTPAFLIDGKLLSGAQPTEVFVKVLDRALAQQ